MFSKLSVRVLLTVLGDCKREVMHRGGVGAALFVLLLMVCGVVRVVGDDGVGREVREGRMIVKGG